MINKRYDIIKKIGQGRSSVYLCKDTEFADIEIALKVLPSTAGQVEKEYFRNEYFTLQKLDHPGIIRALEIGTVLNKTETEEVGSGDQFISLEYFSSSELLDSKFISDEKSLKIIVKQLCSVLFYLHQSNYIYYDLKPENILAANAGGSPIIKLIDLGFAKLKGDHVKKEIKGTAHYIAPELLKNEEHDHRADLYSLGILLYRIIYDRFPFDSEDELSIYKSHIESEFSFPGTSKFSDGLINAVKKLVTKNPDERYQNSLQVLADLGIKIDDSITKYLLPAKVFSDRSDVINILSAYINDKTSSEVFTLKGFDGAGKTAILNSVFEIYPDVVKVSSQKGKSGIRLVKHILKEILFTKAVYQSFDHGASEKIIALNEEPDSVFIKELAKTFSQIAQKSRFILLIDDFNLLDDLAFEILRSAIPVFQINGIKIILAETADSTYRSTEINNVKDILLSSFTDIQVTEFINQSYSPDFPGDELINLIFKYSDFLPGSIISFIKDLLLLKIIRYLPEGVKIHKDEKDVEVLKSSQDVLFNFRLSKLSKTELKVIQIISALDVIIDLNALADLIEIPYQKLFEMIYKFQVDNILQHFSADSSLVITSEGFKKHIYSTIKNKAGFHQIVAGKIEKNLKNFSKAELARQYENAGKYESCCEIYLKEIEEIEQHSAYFYMKKILEHLLSLPLDENRISLIKEKLAETYFKLSDYRSALQVIGKFNHDVLPKIRMIEGSSLIGRGEFEAGRKVFNELLEENLNMQMRNEILIELAYADLEQQLYDEAVEICSSLLKDDELTPEQKGRSHNLLAMCHIYKNNDVDGALADFIKAGVHFKNADLPRRVAGIEVNVGNIFNILGHHNKAEEHWSKASEINKSIGNLEQEGLILLNVGIFYYNHRKFEKAVENYKNALKIFLSLGNQMNQGLVHYNLSEVYLAGCEYQNVINSLQSALKIFEANDNKEELSEVLYLFGKFYYLIGFKSKLEEIIIRFKKILDDNGLLNKHMYYLKFLEIMNLMLEDKLPEIEELRSIREIFKELDERNKYTEVNFTIIKTLIDIGQFEEALIEINDTTFVEIISRNSILEAHRAYFLAGITANLKSEKQLTPLEYLEQAYDFIKDESITEITWKILVGISDIYFERGNFHKAKSFYHYAELLINFIIENIESGQLRKSYINQKEVKSALKKIELYKSA